MAQASGKHQVVLRDHKEQCWLGFERAFESVFAKELTDVVPALEYIQAQVDTKGYYAAGFICYEAAGAFDSALKTHPAPGELPFFWFGLYRGPELLELPAPNYNAYQFGDIQPSISGSEYHRAIQAIKEHIYAGNTYQVNYTIRFYAQFSGDPWQLFLAMVRAQSSGYGAWIDIGSHQICSASPELFFKMEGDQLTCKPMKGTVKRGRTAQEDRGIAEWLRKSEKNRAENLMIVDMIRNDLGRIAEFGSVSVPALFEVERHPTLWQMTSTITAKCKKPIHEIFGALFPCASITGAPKIRTSQIIAELESHPRGIYTGAIGFIAPGRRAQFNVAIRTAVVDCTAAVVEYGSGGGIVWDSGSADEYREVLLKARVLTEKIADFDLLETLLWTPEEGFFLLDLHLKRLADSAQYFDYAVNIREARERLLQASTSYELTPHRIRLLAKSDGKLDIISEPLLVSNPEQPLRVKLAATPVNSMDPFLYHKTTRRELYEAARRSCPDCDDVLLWNERGEVTESTIANIVVNMNGRLYTPPVSSGLLAGTFREWLLEQGKIQERAILISDLKHCIAIYLINSVRKWQKARLV